MFVIQTGGYVLVEIVVDADRQVVLASSCHVAAEVIQIGVIIAAGEQDRVGLFRHDRYGIEGVVSVLCAFQQETSHNIAAMSGIGGLMVLTVDIRI